MHPARRLFVDRSPPAVRPQQALRRLRSRSLAVGQGEAPFPRALQQPCKAHEVTVIFGAGAATRTVAHYRPSCYLRLWLLGHPTCPASPQRERDKIMTWMAPRERGGPVGTVGDEGLEFLSQTL